MMRSDMPKQVMAYRNGGGLPSLATAPMEFSNGGGIGAFVSNAYNKAVDVVKDALGMGESSKYPNYGPPGTSSTSSGNAAENYRKSRKAKKKKKARQAAAREAAAAAAAAEQQGESITTADDVGLTGVDGGITTLTPGVADQSIINMVNQRDDLTAAQKLEFAQSLGANLGVADGAGVQFAVDNLSNVALDPTSGLSDADRVSALTTLSQTTGTDYSGLINTLNNQIAANNLANINNIATTTPGADIISNVATTPAVNTVQNNATMVPAAPATYTGYAPIVPAANISTAGIAGLPSTNTSTIQPYTFTAFTPDAYTPATNPLVLPPLG
jgi:hypothetical protein